jgi:hypothetical protein
MIRDGNRPKTQFPGFDHQLPGGEVPVRSLGMVVQVSKYRRCHHGVLLMYYKNSRNFDPAIALFQKLEQSIFFKKIQDIV